MTQEERWRKRYNEVKTFIETNHCNPSRHRIEDHDMLNRLKANRKKMNAGELKEPRLTLFKELLVLSEQYKRKKNINDLFTSNLSVLSGALLYKTVFAFRLAYILEVKRILGVTLPIILDSPSGKEIDNQNIQMMINILKRDFSDHQIIIASIFEYDLPDVNVIEIKKRLLEDS